MLLWKIVTAPKAMKQIQKLDHQTKKRISEKLEYYASLPNPKDYAEVLVNFTQGSYRYRIGDYRIIVDFDEQGRMIIVGLIGHRKSIYK